MNIYFEKQYQKFNIELLGNLNTLRIVNNCFSGWKKQISCIKHNN